MQDILNKIESIEIKKPSDIVLEKIRALILNGSLSPGDQLPPERELSSKFGVGRGHIREAIKKLEFYGILKTYPQRGTIVANRGVTLLEHMISNIIHLEMNDKHSLLEVREILEINAARLTAERISKEQLQGLQTILDSHKKAVHSGEGGLNEDLVFHLGISEYSGNTFIHSMIMLITPQVHKISTLVDSCREERALNAWQEHENILVAIAAHDQDRAGEAMAFHLKKSCESFSIQ